MNVPKSVFPAVRRSRAGRPGAHPGVRPCPRAGLRQRGIRAAGTRPGHRGGTGQPSLRGRSCRAASGWGLPMRVAPRWTWEPCRPRRSTSRSPRSAPTPGCRSPARTILPSSTASRWCWRARPFTATTFSACGRSSWPSAGARVRDRRPRMARCSSATAKGSSAVISSNVPSGSWWTAAMESEA